jgi:hypothetical protein
MKYGIRIQFYIQFKCNAKIVTKKGITNDGAKGERIIMNFKGATLT